MKAPALEEYNDSGESKDGQKKVKRQETSGAKEQFPGFLENLPSVVVNLWQIGHIWLAVI